MKKTTFFALIAFFAMSITSCNKEKSPEPFWSDAKKFEFQNKDYIWTDGTQVQFINIADWNEATPNVAHVQIYNGVTGGQVSFSNPAPQQNYTYITSSNSYNGTYQNNDIVINGERISVKYTGAIQATASNVTFDFRKIESLTYQGKTFVPNPINYFMATENQSGVAINRMVSHEMNCSFTTCVNGQSQEVQWQLNTKTMTITSPSLSITGTIIESPFATPIIETASGERYIVQFFSLAENSQVACRCTMQFKLYKIDANSFAKTDMTSKATLTIGNC